jgi:hypothetical protein
MGALCNLPSRLHGHCVSRLAHFFKSRNRKYVGYAPPKICGRKRKYVGFASQLEVSIVLFFAASARTNQRGTGQTRNQYGITLELNRQLV